MDVLLSVPMASYFFSTSSLSTSLNFLFFYMTWATLVLSHSPLRLEVMGIAIIRVVLWLLPSFIFLLFDALVPSLAENIKYSGAAALPPREIRKLARMVLLAILNLGLETAVEGIVSLSLTMLFKTPVFRTSTTLPLPWQMAKHIALLLTARELLTYYLHRYILHSRANPSVSLGNCGTSVSEWHHRYGHSRRAPPYSLALMVDHPVPFLLHRFLPFYLPALVLHRELHLLTFFVFVGLITIEETLAMSGYTIVPGFIMAGITRRSALHYCNPVGNFGCWGFSDWLHGTSQGKDVISDMKDKGKEHDLMARGSKVSGNAGQVVQDRLRKSIRSRG